MRPAVRNYLLLILLVIVLIPTLFQNGDIFDLLSALPFFTEVFKIIASALNFSTQFPNLAAANSVPAEVLKTFFVATMSMFITKVFTIFVTDRRYNGSAIRIWNKFIVSLVAICLTSLFYSSIRSILGDGGVLAAVFGMLVVNFVIGLFEGTTSQILGRNGLLISLGIELMKDVAQVLAIMIVIIFGYIFFIGNSATIRACGATGAAIGIVMLGILLMIGKK